MVQKPWIQLPGGTDGCPAGVIPASSGVGITSPESLAICVSITKTHYSTQDVHHTHPGSHSYRAAHPQQGNPHPRPLNCCFFISGVSVIRWDSCESKRFKSSSLENYRRRLLKFCVAYGELSSYAPCSTAVDLD